MATPTLAGFNLLDPRTISAMGTAFHGLTRTHDGGDVFTVSGTVSSTTTAFQILNYADYSISDYGYACQVFHISGDRIVTGAYGFRNATEKALAINVSVEVGKTYTETFGVTVSDGGLPEFRAYRYPMIFDRTRFDVQAVKERKADIIAGTATQDELDEYAAGMKGAMSGDDWTRIYTAIGIYRTNYPGSSIDAADVTAFNTDVVSKAGIIPATGFAALKDICEAIITDGVTSDGPEDFGNGSTLTFRQANNIERLLSIAAAE